MGLPRRWNGRRGSWGGWPGWRPVKSEQATGAETQAAPPPGADLRRPRSEQDPRAGRAASPDPAPPSRRRLPARWEQGGPRRRGCGWVPGGLPRALKAEAGGGGLRSLRPEKQPVVQDCAEAGQRPSSVRGEVKGRSESRRTLQQPVCHPCRAAGDRLVFSASVRGECVCCCRSEPRPRVSSSPGVPCLAGQFSGAGDHLGILLKTVNSDSAGPGAPREAEAAGFPWKALGDVLRPHPAARPASERGARGLGVARWAPTEGSGREAEAAGRPGRGEALRPGDAGDGREHHGSRRLKGERGGPRIGGECAPGLRSLDRTGSWAPGCKCIPPGPVPAKRGRENASSLHRLLSTHELSQGH
nr:translation initiation factor IF-2-like [Ovis aries]